VAIELARDKQDNIEDDDKGDNGAMGMAGETASVDAAKCIQK